MFTVRAGSRTYHFPSHRVRDFILEEVLSWTTPATQGHAPETRFILWLDGTAYTDINESTEEFLRRLSDWIVRGSGGPSGPLTPAVERVPIDYTTDWRQRTSTDWMKHD